MSATVEAFGGQYRAASSETLAIRKVLLDESSAGLLIHSLKVFVVSSGRAYLPARST